MFMSNDRVSLGQLLWHNHNTKLTGVSLLLRRSLLDVSMSWVYLFVEKAQNEPTSISLWIAHVCDDLVNSATTLRRKEAHKCTFTLPEAIFVS